MYLSVLLLFECNQDPYYFEISTYLICQHTHSSLAYYTFYFASIFDAGQTEIGTICLNIYYCIWFCEV